MGINENKRISESGGEKQQRWHGGSGSGGGSGESACYRRGHGNMAKMA